MEEFKGATFNAESQFFGTLGQKSTANWTVYMLYTNNLIVIQHKLNVREYHVCKKLGHDYKFEFTTIQERILPNLSK